MCCVLAAQALASGVLACVVMWCTTDHTVSSCCCVCAELARWRTYRLQVKRRPTAPCSSSLTAHWRLQRSSSNCIQQHSSSTKRPTAQQLRHSQHRAPSCRLSGRLWQLQRQLQQQHRRLPKLMLLLESPPCSSSCESRKRQQRQASGSSSSSCRRRWRLQMHSSGTCRPEMLSCQLL